MANDSPATKVPAQSKALLAKWPSHEAATPGDIGAMFVLGEGAREYAVRCVIVQTAKRSNERAALCRQVADAIGVKAGTVQGWVTDSGLEPVEARLDRSGRSSDPPKPPKTVDDRVADALAQRDAARADAAEARTSAAASAKVVRRVQRVEEAGDADDLDAALVTIEARVKERWRQEMREEFADALAGHHCACCSSGSADTDDGGWVDP